MSAMPDRASLTLANIVWLLAAMGFVIAPHAERLPIWVTLFCAGVGGWRAWIASRGLRIPHFMVMALLAVAATAGTYLIHGRLYGREASTTLLIVMLCLKMLEMRSRRDALLAIFLGFFLVFTNFLFSQTLLMGAYMLFCILIFMATLIGFNRIGSQATVAERMAPAIKLVGLSIPLMLVFFLLFPRLSTPLWRLPTESAKGMTGLSDTMAPGDLNQLIRSEQVAFRADFKGGIPRNETLYWRGPVLTEFDGRTWRAPPWAGVPISVSAIQPRGTPIEYSVTIEPHGRQWLFALDMPLVVPAEAQLLSDFQLRANRQVLSLQRYDMRSSLEYSVGRELSENARKLSLRLPQRSNPRATEYAKNLRAQFPDDRQLLRNTLLTFNREFTYTLEPPILGAQPVDEFLFDTKRGFCEHYSSAFVFLMRAAGIPARVATGYQGGEINTIGNYLIVRQADAHAWAEVWLEGDGWVRIDPTAAVAPERIERGMDVALGPVGNLPNLIAADPFGVLRQLRFAWDAANNQWNQWVIGYNKERQQFLLNQFGIDAADWRSIAIWLIVGCLATGLFVSLVLLVRWRGEQRDPVQAAYLRYVGKLKKYGLERRPSEGPVDFLARIQANRPELGAKAAEVTQLYVALRYGQIQDADAWGAFKALTRESPAS